MDHNPVDKLKEQGVGQLFKPHVFTNNPHEFIRVHHGIMNLFQFPLNLGGAGLEVLLLLFIVGGQFHEPLVRDAPGHAVLIQPLEDTAQLRDAPGGGVQFPALVGVLLPGPGVRLRGENVHQLVPMLVGVGRQPPQILRHALGQSVRPDEVRGADAVPLLVVPAQVAVLMPPLRGVPLLVHDAPAVGAYQQAGEQAHFAVTVGPPLVLAEFLHPLPYGGFNNRLVGIFKYHPLFLRVLHAGLDFIRLLFRLKIHRMSHVFLVFQNVNNGICRPLAGIVRVVAAGTSGIVPGVGMFCSVSLRAICVGPYPARHRS